jgi:hypothetical protein
MKMTGKLPADWVEVRFQEVRKPTDYSLIEEERKGVVKAVSEASASGIGRPLHLHVQDYPILVWQWKAVNLVEKSNLDRKEGDDYAARIYVAFDHDGTALGLFERILFRLLELIYRRRTPARALNYI